MRQKIVDIGPVFQKRHEPVSTTIRVHLLQLLISKGAIIRKSSPSDLSSGPQDLIDTRRTRKEKNAEQHKNHDRITADHSAADTVRKSDFFSSILIFPKEKFPHFIQVKRQTQAGLKEYPCSSLNNSSNLIQYRW